MQFPMREAAEMAFRLAYFIHLDRPLAVSITAQALSGLEKSIVRQRKRLYYLPRRKVRTKVSLDELQELQRLVFFVSETCEAQQEQADCTGLGEADWIIRFVKHLVAITVRRSAFYVAVGLSRLLYSYSTAETTLIFDLVRQDEERSKDLPYFRKQKTLLMKEMNERFGTVLRTHRASHGEERFVTREDSERYVALVRQCLNMFTLWDTTCVLPERFDPVSDTINALCFDGGEPDGEHRVEIRRMHTLLHPDCYERLVAALGLASPAQRLSVPVFSCCSDAGGDRRSNDDERVPAGLLEKEFAEISGFVKEERARRQKTPPTSLSVKVDGSERAMLGLDDLRPVRLIVGDHAKLLEVCGRDAQGEIVLAYFFLTHGELCRARPSKTYSFSLARGRKLLLSVVPHMDAGGEITGADLELAYRRAWPLGVAAKFLQRSRGEALSHALRRPALAFSLIGLTLLIAAGLLIGVTLLRRSSSKARPDSGYIAQVAEPVTPAPPTGPQHDSGQGDSQPEINQNGPSRNMPESRGSAGPPLPANATGRTGRVGRTAEGVRDLGVESVRELLSVKVVYVEKPADGPNAGVRESIISRIAASRRLTVSEEPQQADAFLLWSLKQVGAVWRIEARLTDRQRRKLWSASQPVAGTAGDKDAMSRAASRLAQDLLDEIARREGATK